MGQRRHHVDATHTPTSAAEPDTDDRRPAALAAAAHDAEVARAAVGTLPDLTGTAVVVMGVSGSGKTALALRLMDVLQLPYAEADEFHSAEAIAKMRGGTPLTDEDRWPWLCRLRSWMSEPTQSGGCIVTCSALRRSYRDLLSDAPGACGSCTWRPPPWTSRTGWPSVTTSCRPRCWPARWPRSSRCSRTRTACSSLRPADSPSRRRRSGESAGLGVPGRCG